MRINLICNYIFRCPLGRRGLPRQRGFTVDAYLGGYKATEVESRESEQSFDFWVGLMTNLFFRQTVQVALLPLRRCTNALSQHLERKTEPQVLDLLAEQNLRRFKMRYVLPRQDYFELIPIRSNNLQPVRGLLGCTLRALSGSDRLLHRPQCL